MLIATACALCVARAAVDPQAESKLKLQEDRARAVLDKLAALPDDLSPTEKRGGQPVLVEETPCFTIDHIVIESDEVRFRNLSDLVTYAQGKCIGAHGLRALVMYLNDHLIDQGYVTTRVLVGEQNLKAGTLTLKVVPGYVSNVHYSDNPNAIWRNVMPTRVGDILNLRDLEQGVEQMQRLGSQQVKTDIQPGAQPGTSEIVINRQRAFPLYGGVQVDNTGTRTFGRLQGNVNVTYDNPFGINDQLSLNVSTNLQHLSHDNRTQSGIFNYSVPYGYNLASVSLADSAFAQVIQGVSQSFVSRGSSDTVTIRDQETVFRTGADRLVVSVDVDARHSKSFIDDTEIVVQRRHTSNIDLGIDYRRRWANGVLDVAYSRRKGLGWFGAQDDLASAYVGGVTLRPDIDTLDLTLEDQFHVGGLALGLSTQIHGQYAHQATLVTDQLSIGTMGSVRGFSGDMTLSAERGWYWRNELSGSLGIYRPYLALDAGRVSGPSAYQLVGNHLAGAMAGVRSSALRVNYDFGLGFPIAEPHGFHGGNINPYFSLGYGF